MDALQAVITFVVGVGGITLGALLSRRNERRAHADRLLTEALNDAVRAIASIAGGAGPEAQREYASALSRVALHGSPSVVATLRRFQDDATTVTDGGRDRLLAVVAAARAELGHRPADEGDLRILLFGAGPVEVEPWALAQRQIRESVDVEAIETRKAAPGGDEELDQLLALAQQEPVTAIQAAYDAVEVALRKIGVAAGIDGAEIMGVARLSNALLERGLISARDDHALAGLVTLRNLAAHGPPPPGRRASEFIVLAEAVMYALSSSQAAAGAPPATD